MTDVLERIVGTTPSGISNLDEMQIRKVGTSEAAGTTVSALSGPSDVYLANYSIPVGPASRRGLFELHRASRFVPMQSWEGFVLDVDMEAGTFRARLHDLTAGSAANDEEAVLYLADVVSDDLELVMPGGVFRWMIGYRDHDYGKRERVSALVFRRLPAWSKADIDAAEEVGRSRADALRWE